LPVWSKYSSGAVIITKQTAEALAAADTTASRLRQRGREEEGVSLTLMVAFGMIMRDEIGQSAPERGFTKRG
jgi:hypothetical protein